MYISGRPYSKDPEFDRLHTVIAVRCLFVEKKFSLRLFLNCSNFLSDLSLNVLIKFALLLKKKKKKRAYSAQSHRQKLIRDNRVKLVDIHTIIIFKFSTSLLTNYLSNCIISWVRHDLWNNI